MFTITCKLGKNVLKVGKAKSLRGAKTTATKMYNERRGPADFGSPTAVDIKNDSTGEITCYIRRR